MPLPKQLEKKFWLLNLDRTRQNISKFLASGVLTYIIFILLVLPTDYFVIGVPYITLDFVYCLLSAMNIAFALLVFWVFARFKNSLSIFILLPVALFFYQLLQVPCCCLVLEIWLLKISRCCFFHFYMLGFILSGIKPLHMLYVGLSAAILVFVLYFIKCEL